MTATFVTPAACMGRAILRFGPVIAVAVGMCGCDLISARDEGPKIEGERISVLSFEQRLESDPRIADLPVRLPRPYINDEWPQPGGYADHAMHHLDLEPQLERIFKVDMGKAASSSTRILAPPIIAEGVVCVLDSIAGVTCADALTGERRWRTVLRPADFKKELIPIQFPWEEGKLTESEEVAFGGGIAYEDGRIFASTGYGFISALDLRSGDELWRVDLEVPIRSAPTVNGGRVFISTHDNEFYALAAEDGRVLWTHQALVETADLLGSSSPAVAGELAVAPFTSGELVALRVENGRTIWSDTLTSTGRYTALGTLADIAGRPVIDRGRVFAASHGGRVVSIDVRTGERIWTRPISAVQTPWVAGDFIYLVTTEQEIVALSRRDGRIRWVTQLRRYEDEEDREDPIEWSGPVLAGNRLVLVSSRGEAMSVSPYDGELLGKISIGEGTFVPPVVANKVLYILNADAELIALR